MRATVHERDARAGDEVRHRARDQHFAEVRDPAYRACAIECDAGDATLRREIALPGVQAERSRAAEAWASAGERAGATDRARRAVERGEETVRS